MLAADAILSTVTVRLDQSWWVKQAIIECVSMMGA
jgi:hypothetical protein